MIAKEEVRKVAESKIKELGGFFVDLKVNKANVITIFFDRTDGVRVEHCLAISKCIETYFDRDIEDYYDSKKIQFNLSRHSLNQSIYQICRSNWRNRRVIGI